MKKAALPFRLFSILASLQLTVIALILLSVLVVWGTFYQVDHGIYAAQERFFKAWLILIAGVIPFPAVKTAVAILSVNLIAAACKRRPVTLRTFGIIVLHCGVAVLIGGSAISLGFVRESAITLAEGQSTDTTYDFNSWRLTVAISGKRDGKPYSNIRHYDLRRMRQHRRIDLSPTTATLSLRHIYQNCSAMISRTDSQTITGLSPLKDATDEGRNMPGVVFSIAADENINTSEGPEYFVYAGTGRGVPFAYGDDTITVSLQPLSLPLPLRIELTRFTAEWHPGTTKAKSFQSRLRIFGKNIDREIVIEMNRPFRYRSYTFYQMGYSEQNGTNTSTLAIVKNPLRYLPYVASIIIVIGLFLHFFVKMWYEFFSVRGNRHEK